MNRIPSLFISAVLFGALSLTAQAQNNSSNSFPFSWAGVSTYSLRASSFSVPGELVRTETGAGNLSYVSELVEKGYFTNLGVGALIVSLDMELLTTGGSPSDSNDVGISGEDCALHGYDIRTDIGGSDSFAEMISASHLRGIRIVLSIDARRWCGTRDVHALTQWVTDYYIDGIRFESADKLSQENLADIRRRFPRRDPEAVELAARGSGDRRTVEAPSGELSESDFWIAGVFPDESQSAVLARTGLLDAVTISDWHLDLSPEDSLSTFYRRAVAFSVDHPTTSIQTQTSSTTSDTQNNIGANPEGRDRLLNDATRLLLQPGAINILPGAESTDTEVVEHWQKLASFRDRHPAIGGGAHEDLSEDPYMFYRGLRVGKDIDQVVVVVGASGQVRLHVSLVFDDDTVLRDAYTGKIVMVSYGQARIAAHHNGVILLEEVR